MMRSMYSGVSGLRVHQTKMDVIGNNIANVNTVGFKRGQVTFQEVFSQVIRGASAPQGGKGGTNPQQIGLGVNIGSISTIHTKGAVQRTDNPTDLMIDGEGFFVVTDDPNFQNKFYTRAGNFDVDGAGNLITADGFKVLGYKFVDGKWTSEIGPIVINKTETVPPTTTKNVEFRGNLDSRMEMPYSIVEVPGATSTDPPTYKLVLNSNGFHKTDTIIRDSLGNGYKVEFEIFKDFDGFAMDDYIEDDPDKPGNKIWRNEISFATKAEAEDALKHSTGNWKYRINSIKALEGSKEYFLDPTDMFKSLGFSIDGSLASGANLTIKIPDNTVGFGEFNPTIGQYNNEIKFDLSKLTQYANEADAKPHALNGNTAGVLDGFAIDATGTIVASFTNNEKRELGQLLLAKFDNPAGLQKIGNNFFIDTRNSGEPQIGRAGTTGLGAIAPGALEMSNVDLSLEFTEMITTQRGFQANSRIITTSDEMLQELVNMKR